MSPNSGTPPMVEGSIVDFVDESAGFPEHLLAGFCKTAEESGFDAPLNGTSLSPQLPNLLYDADEGRL